MFHNRIIFQLVLADGEKEHKGSCSGDSGAPLFVKDDQEQQFKKRNQKLQICV